jgi:hypothetical protein
MTKYDVQAIIERHLNLAKVEDPEGIITLQLDPAFIVKERMPGTSAFVRHVNQIVSGVSTKSLQSSPRISRSKISLKCISSPASPWEQKSLPELLLPPDHPHTARNPLTPAERGDNVGG